jgi:hypothetical protein
MLHPPFVLIVALLLLLPPLLFLLRRQLVPLVPLVLSPPPRPLLPTRRRLQLRFQLRPLLRQRVAAASGRSTPSTSRPNRRA